ncbi:YeiH family protein [Peribacillus asahii]|uniref:YeiH family protein n=1 Tax=Peribacillus asahii TaxID=228899 RepID=A0A398BP47_9BACI|nr:YeiH family protein [Peribacillus asahii]RID89133.1 YeiH family protein [Peribacillus asahii]
MQQPYTKEQQKKIFFFKGIGLTFVIALSAKCLAWLPFFNMMGQLVIAILIGMAWRAAFKVPDVLLAGANFSSKKLLRFGIILLGMRLNFVDMIDEGPNVLVLAVINMILTLIIVYGLARLFKIDENLGILTACGTAICGAAAVVAVAPQLKAKDNEIAIAAATVAILGTIFTMSYTVLYPIMHLSAHGYGIFSGTTLHEIAHVIAAAEPAGKDAIDTAIIVKLTRVALLVPVAIVIGIWMNRSKNNKRYTTSWTPIPIPWFIFGFLAMSVINSLGIIPAYLVYCIVLLAYTFIAMAMAGLGLNVNIVILKKLGFKPFSAGFVGSILLSILGYVLMHLLNLV